MEKVVEMAKEYFKDLRMAGFGVWAIGHTRFRTIKEKGNIEEEGYMQLTSNLQANYEAIFGDIFDCTLTGYIDRELEEETVGEGDNEKIRRKATGEMRKLYLRGTTLIDAGGRFEMGAVPEYILFDKPNMAKDLIEVLERGMELSKTGALNNKDVVVKTPTPPTPKVEVKIETPKVEEKVEEEVIETPPVEETVEDIMETVEDSADELIEELEAVDEELNKTLKNKVAGKYKEASDDQKKAMKAVLKKFGAKKLDLDKPTEMFEEILRALS